MNTGEVTIYGNRKIKTYIIRREIQLRSGEPFDQKKVDEARRRIQRIPGVDFSEIRVTYSPRDSALSLNVVVTEKSAFHGSPVIQRGLENLFSFGLWVSQDNFRGRSETLGASALVYGGTIVNAKWENPWLGSGPRIGIGLAGYYRNYEYVYDDLGGVFEGARIEKYGGDFSVFYTFRSGFRVLGEAGYMVADSDREGVTNEPGGDQIPVYTLGLRYDSRGSRLFPWSGWYLRAEGSAVGPGEEGFSIVRGRVDARFFLPLFGRTVLALQVRPRVNDGDRVPVYMREHIGGGMTLRGYDYGDFNATSSIVTGAEYRIPINFDRRYSVEDRLLAASLHLFYDAGAVWELDQSPDDGELWHDGFGLGILLLNSWFRGLRFDYGWNRDSNGRFHFEFGAKF
jgi:outer membrane protein assembly factor BamA